MSGRLRLALQLALAALVASAGGGIVFVLLLAVGGLVADLLGGASVGIGNVVTAAVIAVMLAGMAVVPAIVAAWPPAFVAGAMLWTFGRGRSWARRRGAWRAAGAAVGSLVWLQAFPPGAAHRAFNAFGLPSPLVGLAFLLAGGAAGQVFRSAMAATAPFFGFDEDSDEA